VVRAFEVDEKVDLVIFQFIVSQELTSISLRMHYTSILLGKN